MTTDSLTPRATINTLDRIHGCLVAGAAGDALGYAVEFTDYRSIIARYGYPGITRYEVNPINVAVISDDTQMTLFTAQGLLQAIERNEDAIEHITQAYLLWLSTQTANGPIIESTACPLLAVPELYNRRAPGNTCLEALRQIARGEEAQNRSKGCGGIMRVAPVGIVGAQLGWPTEKVIETACRAAAITHKHPLGYLPAGVMAWVVAKLIVTPAPTPQTIINATTEAMQYISATHPGKKDVECLLRGISLAIDLASRHDMADIDAIVRLGQGWVGEEALFIALYCSLRHFDSIEDALVAAVNHSGDSDSTGAITGNILGAALGHSAIPEHLRSNLEISHVITDMAHRLSFIN